LILSKKNNLLLVIWNYIVAYYESTYTVVLRQRFRDLKLAPGTIVAQYLANKFLLREKLASAGDTISDAAIILRTV